MIVCKLKNKKPTFHTKIKQVFYYILLMIIFPYKKQNCVY